MGVMVMAGRAGTGRRDPVDGRWDSALQGLLGAPSTGGTVADPSPTVVGPQSRCQMVRRLREAAPEVVLLVLVVLACGLTAIAGMLGAIH